MKAVYKSRKERRGIINLVFIYANAETSLQIGLTFLSGSLGILFGGLINFWIHRSGLKNIKTENQKDREARESANDKAISAQIALAVVEFMKVNMPAEEVVKIFKNSNEVANLIIKDLNKKLSKTKEEIEETGANYNKELDNDIINTNEEYGYARQN